MRVERLEGWAITGWAAALMAVVVVLASALTAGGQEAAREVVRWSVRLGTVVFCATFAARPLHQWISSGATKWLLRNRRALGVSFSVMHFTHLGALAILALAFPVYFTDGVDAATLYGGGLAYVLLLAMTITSFDRTAAWMGRCAWKALHTTGAWVLWGILTLNYTGATLDNDPRYAPLSLLLLATFALRIGARLLRRPRPMAQPSPG